MFYSLIEVIFNLLDESEKFNDENNIYKNVA